MISSSASSITENKPDEFNACTSQIFTVLQIMSPSSLTQIAEIGSQLTRLPSNAVTWLALAGLSPVMKFFIESKFISTQALSHFSLTMWTGQNSSTDRVFLRPSSTILKEVRLLRVQSPKFRFGVCSFRQMKQATPSYISPTARSCNFLSGWG